LNSLDEDDLRFIELGDVKAALGSILATLNLG
jgi:hypothetical protein